MIRILPLLGLLALAHLCLGARLISPEVLWQAVTAFDPGRFDDHILLTLRLPRMLAAMIAGAGLGLAGYLTQVTLRNRLGEPQILGLNAGASLAVVLSTAFLSMPAGAVPLTAAGGAGLAFAFVLALGAGGREPARLIFAGLAVSALASSLTSALLILDEDSLDSLKFWLVGDTVGARLPDIIAALPVAILGAILAVVVTPGLAALTLGAETAQGLGLNVHRARVLAMLAAALLSGAAVSLVGPIGFIGLAAPAFWPRLHARPSRRALAKVAASGAALLLTADLLATHMLAPRELPAGAVTGLLGGPLFLWLLGKVTK